MPSFDQLQMFVAAAEKGSFSAAARTLGKGQSAVSLGIANLEVDLGFELFDRTTRKPGLTEDGERLLVHAQAVLQQFHDFSAAASGLAANEEPRIRIVLDDAILVPSFGQVLDTFGKKFRATRIEILSAASPDVPEIIGSGSADIGLMFSALKVQEGLEQVFIGNLPFVSVCRPDFPLAAYETIGANDLLGHRQLLLRSTKGSALEQFPPLSPEIWHAAHFHTLRDMVLAGLGWAYLPEHLVSGAIASGELVRLNLRFEHRHWSPPVECVSIKNMHPGPALSWLLDRVVDILPQTGQGST